MKKLKEIGLTFLLILILIICLIFYYLKGNEEDTTKELKNIKILSTIITKLEDNTIFCPTFQLVWNELKNEVVKQDIILIDDENNQTVLELNKETFKETDLNEELYYKKYGFQTISLKEEIKQDIKNKFNQESEILDTFEFYQSSRDYFFYAMLYKEFEFLNPFDILDDNNFGINSNSDSKLDKNVDVLFYNSLDNYAVILKTTTGDEIILYKGDRKHNFLDTYQSLNLDEREEFLEEDTIIISNLNFKVNQNFKEIEGKEILINNEIYEIGTALEIIEFKMDNKGGKIKSEAGLSFKATVVDKGRHFDFSDNFVLFVKEETKNLPYLAINIKNIKEFQ